MAKHILDDDPKELISKQELEEKLIEREEIDNENELKMYQSLVISSILSNIIYSLNIFLVKNNGNENWK